MRILFFGLPLAAWLLHEDGHDVVHAVLCRPGALGERRLRRVLGDGRVERRPRLEDRDVVTRLARVPADLLVSWFWTTRIPQPLLAAAPLGAVGVHPSLLPRHRGPDPYFWAIERGDDETGVTAHLLDEAYDTGAILAQRPLAIDPTWNGWTLAKRLDRPSLALLRAVVRAYAEGRPPAPIPQDERLATAAPSPGDALLEVDWTRSAAAIARRVRAAAPFPGAFTFIGDEPVILTRVGVREDAPRALRPGEAWVVRRDDGGAPLEAAVRAGDGAVTLLEGREEEDDGAAALDAAALARRVDEAELAQRPRRR